MVEIPIFHYEIDPFTQQVISQTTQVQEVIKHYTIPFTKAKVEEISKYFRNPVSCVVVAPDGRRYSVSLEQFKSLSENDGNHAQKEGCIAGDASSATFSNSTGRPYSDYVVDGVPIWQKENRGMTKEEGEAFVQETERLKKLADKGS